MWNPCLHTDSKHWVGNMTKKSSPLHFNLHHIFYIYWKKYISRFLMWQTTNAFMLFCKTEKKKCLKQCYTELFYRKMFIKVKLAIEKSKCAFRTGCQWVGVQLQLSANPTCCKVHLSAAILSVCSSLSLSINVSLLSPPTRHYHSHFLSFSLPSPPVPHHPVPPPFVFIAVFISAEKSV